jgi:hypothetical protein
MGNAGVIDGTFDEIRFSNITRTESWYQYTYYNINGTDDIGTLSASETEAPAGDECTPAGGEDWIISTQDCSASDTTLDANGYNLIIKNNHELVLDNCTLKVVSVIIEDGSKFAMNSQTIVEWG